MKPNFRCSFQSRVLNSKRLTLPNISCNHKLDPNDCQKQNPCFMVTTTVSSSSPSA
jgi:hypothetical protein